jgi:hypothetical protein
MAADKPAEVAFPGKIAAKKVKKIRPCFERPAACGD